MSEKILVAHKKFSFGKQAVFSKRKVNEIVIEANLYKDENGKPIFSASGEVWNSRHSDIECGGQCIDSIGDDYYKPIKRNPLYVKIRNLWKRNHLNDMTAGSPKQEEAVKAWEAEGNRYDYDKVCEMLKRKRIYTDKSYLHNGKPYTYGTAWLLRPISKDDLVEMCELLECDISDFQP